MPPVPRAREPLVLIVDDNERNRRLAREVLRAAGLRTVEAATGGEGIALAAELEPDVILLDLALPDVDGATVAVELRRGSRTMGIPVVAVSARPYAGDRDTLRAAGFAGYLEKPIDVGAFPEQVRRYCRPANA
ncbi:MAG TPA: response regulator [Gaiellaceae bacterium]|jgi:two-component system cell cycle response regulator DivK|nr:response regulator [Gaiellaceae bacterium]